MAARIKELGPAKGLEYPRYHCEGRSMTVAEFKKEFRGAGRQKLEKQLDLWTLRGTR